MMFEAEIRTLLKEHLPFAKEWEDGIHYPCEGSGCRHYFEADTAEEMPDLLAEHHAEVVATWLEERLNVKWGTMRPNGFVTPHTEEGSARWYAAQEEVYGPVVVVHKYGTDWKEA